MMRKLYKAIALLMALAMLSGLALSEGVLDALDTEPAFEDTEGLDIEEAQIPDVVDEIPAELDLTLEALDLQADVTYRFIVEGEEYASQVAQAGEEIVAPKAPDAPGGKAFAGWVLADGTPLFAGDKPVIVRDGDLGTEVYVWAEFIEREEAEQPAEAQPEEAQPAEAQPEEEQPEEEQPAEEQPAEEQPEEEEPAEEEPAEEQPAEEEPAEEEPAEEQPVEEEPAEEEPAEEEPVEEEPAEEEPAEEEPVEEEPAGEEPAEEEPEEEPAGEEPAEEQPAEEEPAEEQPEEEQPAEAQPEEEQPAEAQPEEEGAPVPNELVYTGEAQALVSGEGWLYSLDGETYSADIPTAVDAGDYTVYYKTAEDAEAQTMTVTVAKADVVLVPPEAMNGVA